VLVTVLLMFGINGEASTMYIRPGAWVTALSAGDLVGIAALQLFCVVGSPGRQPAAVLAADRCRAGSAGLCILVPVHRGLGRDHGPLLVFGLSRLA
jgi:hypothetical protein